MQGCNRALAGLRKPRLAILAALLIGCLLPASATAAGKPYSVTLSPVSVPAGSDATIVAKFTNSTSQQQLGSANLTAPARFALKDATTSVGSATISGSRIELRQLAVPPGGSVQVSVRVSVACQPGTYDWSVIAKQSNDFKGTPGNDLDLDAQASTLTSTVTGGCALRFRTQPNDARVNERLTGLDFDPSGPPVDVEVVDGAGARVTTSTAPVAVSLVTAGGLGTLHGSTTAAAASGLATFSDLSMDAPGTYQLLASSAGLASDTSALFTVQDVAVECVEDVDCAATASNPRADVDVTAPANAGTDAGFLLLSLNAGVQPDCVGYAEYSADWAVVVGPDRGKHVTFAIDKKVMNARPDNGAAALQMCFSAPYTFATRPGTPLVGSDLDGVPGIDSYTGLLPDCGVPPCVSGRHKGNAGDGIVDVDAPAGTIDPAYRP